MEGETKSHVYRRVCSGQSGVGLELKKSEDGENGNVQVTEGVVERRRCRLSVGRESRGKSTQVRVRWSKIGHGCLKSTRVKPDWRMWAGEVIRAGVVDEDRGSD